MRAANWSEIALAKDARLRVTSIDRAGAAQSGKRADVATSERGVAVLL
jgi:hypothetical protein